MKEQEKITDIRPQIATLIGNKPPYSWASDVGIPKGSFFKIWNKGAAPLLPHLIQIADQEGVTLDWLITGKGRMYRGENFDEKNGAKPDAGQIKEGTHPNPHRLFPENFDSKLFKKVSKAVERIIDQKKVILPPQKISDINLLSYSDAFWKGKIINEDYINILVDLAS